MSRMAGRSPGSNPTPGRKSVLGRCRTCRARTAGPSPSGPGTDPDGSRPVRAGTVAGTARRRATAHLWRTRLFTPRQPPVFIPPPSLSGPPPPAPAGDGDEPGTGRLATPPPARSRTSHYRRQAAQHEDHDLRLQFPSPGRDLRPRRRTWSRSARAAHGPPGVELLGGDADLGAEAELAAVGEPGRGVDRHRRRVDQRDEPLGRRLRVGHDRVGVGRAVAGDVGDGRLQRRTTAAAMS